MITIRHVLNPSYPPQSSFSPISNRTSKEHGITSMYHQLLSAAQEHAGMCHFCTLALLSSVLVVIRVQADKLPIYIVMPMRTLS